MPDDTIEGAELALVIGKTLKRLLERNEVNRNAVPLAIAITDAICENRPLQIPWNMLYR
jgi:glycerol-3-phosphate dehydrogenase (NAD(P)+)